MKLSSQIRPISYFKSNTAKAIREISETREPLVITQNGEAQAVVLDIATYEETQETMALLKILALGSKEIRDGKTVLLKDAIKSVRNRRSR